jgi:hypothetical protein
MEYPLSRKRTPTLSFDKQEVIPGNPSHFILNALKMKDRLLKYFEKRHLWWTVTVIPESTASFICIQIISRWLTLWYQLTGFIFMFIMRCTEK